MGIIDRLKSKFDRKNLDEPEQKQNIKTVDIKAQDEAELFFKYALRMIDSYKDSKRNPEEINNSLDNAILGLIHINPNTLNVLDEHDRNLTMICAQNRLEGVVLSALEKSDLFDLLHQDDEGKNIGMYSIENGLGRATMECMSIPELTLQTDNNDLSMLDYINNYMNKGLVDIFECNGEDLCFDSPLEQ